MIVPSLSNRTIFYGRFRVHSKMSEGGSTMYHAFLKAGRIKQVECDLRNVERKMDELQAVLIFSANSTEEYQRKLTQDRNGTFDSQ